MTLVRDIVRCLEQFAPPVYQESYDNAGLLVGNGSQSVTGILLTLDTTEAVVAEAQAKHCNLIVSHHPIVFKGLKRLNGNNYVERTVMQAIKNDIALYAAHTNLDAVASGVNAKIASKIGLQHTRILAPKPQTLSQLVSFVPVENTEAVLEALYAAGAGNVGKYSGCSFRVTGTGTFTPGSQANPYLGEIHRPESATENRIELIFPTFLKHVILTALRSSHPYEEVAYYLTDLQNENKEVGFGLLGELPQALSPEDFLSLLKLKMNLTCIRHTSFVKDKVQRVAVCGGSGSFLLKDAIRNKADVFVSADFKYHEFFDAENHLIIADIGHYESEVFTKELFFEILSDKFTNIALVLSETMTNPIRYYR